MKFKHAFHVFVDNFSVTYKQLLFRVIIWIVGGAIGATCLYPFVKDFINSQALNELTENAKSFALNFLKGNMDSLAGFSESVKAAYEQIIALLQTRITEIVLCGLLLLLLYIVEKWFDGLCNFTTAVVINDKMALRAKSPFIGSLISNLKKAAIYNLIYVPVSILYDVVIFVLLLFALYFLVNIEFLFVGIFLFVLLFVLAIALKMTFTTDWLPALIRGKMGQKEAIRYTFSRKGKDTLNVFSNFIVLILIVLAINVAAALFTFGVGVLITLPASYVILISFEMVNFYDREEIRYSIDKNTIIKPDKEHIITREEFFRGSDDDGVNS